MNSGLPGAGIGITFYLVASFLMPIFELKNHLVKKTAYRSALILRQVFISLGVIFGIYLASVIVYTITPVYLNNQLSSIYLLFKEKLAGQQVFGPWSVTLLLLFCLLIMIEVYSFLLIKKAIKKFALENSSNTLKS